jgi:glycosyltransferase involved in cell wall biosynthesis
VLVSIIVNNYNYGRFLSAAIDSALCQSYRSVEVIVVDDGSTDLSRDIIGSYGSRVTSFLKNNGGQASALNAGFAQSHGDAIIFLDADDVLLPYAAQRVAETFVAQPATAKVQYRMAVIDGDGNPTGAIKPPRHIPLPSGDLKRSELWFPFDLAWLPTSGNAFAAWALQRIFPIPGQVYGQVGADWYLAHLAPLMGPVVSLDEVCACYRVHTANHYELSAPSLDLAHIRQTIAYADHTRCYLQRYAEQLNLPDRPGEILSVSYVANRITSLKLGPDQHAIAGDTVGQLFRLALVAIARRRDVAWPMKAMFRVWFAAIVLAPPPAARWLAIRFLYPETRSGLNQVLRIFHSGS